MPDMITGKVPVVFTDEAFELQVEYRDPQNRKQYHDSERVWIAHIEAPKEDSPQNWSKETLENKIKGKTVVCFVQKRGAYGQLVCTVKV